MTQPIKSFKESVTVAELDGVQTERQIKDLPSIADNQTYSFGGEDMSPDIPAPRASRR